MVIYLDILVGLLTVEVELSLLPALGTQKMLSVTQVYMVLTHLPRLTDPHMKAKAIIDNSIIMGWCCLELFLYKARLVNPENRCDIQVMSLKSMFKRTSAETFPAPTPPLVPA